jgi:hypothetical protein
MWVDFPFRRTRLPLWERRVLAHPPASLIVKVTIYSSKQAFTRTLLDLAPTWLVLLGLPSIGNSTGLELMARLERSGEKLRHYLRDSNGRLDKQTGKGAIQPYLGFGLRPQVTHTTVNMYV